MRSRRVKITGIGLVTPAGIGREDFTEGILSGRSFVRNLQKLDDELGGYSAATVESFRLLDWLPRKRQDKNSPDKLKWHWWQLNWPALKPGWSFLTLNRSNPSY